VGGPVLVVVVVVVAGSGAGIGAGAITGAVRIGSKAVVLLIGVLKTSLS
jgi:hypothetical protein